jgi:molybdopterin-binding protein
MNTFKGTISSIESHDSFRLVEVDINGEPMKLITLELDERFHERANVLLLVKETDIVIAKNRSGTLSIENKYPCSISGVNSGEVFSEIAIDSPLGAMTALVGRSAQDSMKLEPDDRIQVFIRANEIALMENKIEDK